MQIIVLFVFKPIDLSDKARTSMTPGWSTVRIHCSRVINGWLSPPSPPFQTRSPWNVCACEMVSTDSGALFLHPQHSSLGTRLIRLQREKAVSISSSECRKERPFLAYRSPPLGVVCLCFQKTDRAENSKNGVLTSVHYMPTERSGASRKGLLSLSLPTHK